MSIASALPPITAATRFFRRLLDVMAGAAPARITPDTLGSSAAARCEGRAAIADYMGQLTAAVRYDGFGALHFLHDEAADAFVVEVKCGKLCTSLPGVRRTTRLG